MRLFPPLEPEIRHTLGGIPRLIDQVFPLPRRFRTNLPRDVAELSLLFTSNRGERNESYLGTPSLLSAYLRYFLPWNLYRLCRLLPSLSLTLTNGDTLIDLGSGPLTLPLALWIARPDLRGAALEFRCLDKTGRVLEAGKRLFSTLAGPSSPWHIKTIRASLGTPLKGPRAALVSAVNVFNEGYWNLPHIDRRALSTLAARNARLLLDMTAQSGSILIVEPGIPRSGEFITALRDSLMEYGAIPRQPCPHLGRCPFPGGKAKWCHFAFGTQDAPSGLLKLSAAAGIPKERATVSFLLAGSLEQETAGEGALSARIISDFFPVSSEKGCSSQGKRIPRYGRYACSVQGMILLTGTRAAIEEQESGALLHILRLPESRDPKSGALVAELG